MTRSPLWREFESGDGALVRVLRALVLAGGGGFLCLAALLPMNWPEQAMLGALTLALAVWVDRSTGSRLATLMLMLLSAYSTVRYAWWRVSAVEAYLHDPGTHAAPLDVFFIALLLLAESYAFCVLLLGYLQTAWPLNRAPAPLPDDPEQWPAVDVLIPTLNEPLQVVRFTVLAAMNMDWPADRLKVWLLDDGRREEFRAFAAEAGVGYLTREDNHGAKAGNINAALGRVNAPYVAIFDCDQVPTRSFLQMTMGWFLRDAKLAMVQTPHRFYSPDPFERNFDQFHAVPGEGQLFHGAVQDGNDLWNATSFCGSCAALRRSALDEAGGMATETVTEDVHTSVRLQKRGWNTAYINLPQAAGLAPERLSAHVQQRMRWARGMMQVLRLERPLTSAGLKPAQRLCYFNAMAHFLCALPRLVFLTAPMIYLVFGRTTIPGEWAAIVAFAAPHLLLASLTHARIHGRHRNSFWGDIYETVMAPYILLPTIAAWIAPHSGRFQVTAKGGVIDHEHYDARIARPYLVLMVFNLVALACAIPRLVTMPAFVMAHAGPLAGWMLQAHGESTAGVVWINVAWVFFNLMVLSVVAGAARETRQRRRSVRVAVAVPSDVVLADGTIVQGVTCDLSSGGVRAVVQRGTAQVAEGDAVRFIFPLLDGSAALRARVVARAGEEIRAEFDGLRLQDYEALAMLLYSRADSWLGWGEAQEPDRPLRSLGRVLRLAVQGAWQIVPGRHGERRGAKGQGKLVAGIAPLVLLWLAGGMTAQPAHAAQAAGEMQLPRATGAAAPAGTFDTNYRIGELGAAEEMQSGLVMHGANATRVIRFTIPENELPKTASLRLRYTFSPALAAQTSHLSVLLNGGMAGTIAVRPQAAGAAAALPMDAVIPLPTALLKHRNQLAVEFAGRTGAACDDPHSPALWVRVDASSTIEVAGEMLKPANDLASLPMPFFEAQADAASAVPIAFLTQPSQKAMQAAGIVASWIGVLSGRHGVRFPVSIGGIPQGNAIVLAENAAELPAGLRTGLGDGPVVAMRSNPDDPYSSVLLVVGEGGDQLVTAATALALHGNTWQGAQARITGFQQPSPRGADDAPRWLSTEQPADFAHAEIEGRNGEPETDGSTPINVTLLLPPDLNYGDQQNVALHLDYRYNSVPLAEGSTLNIYVNGAWVSSTPMPHTDRASEVLETTVPVPVSKLRPFANTFSFEFAFRPAASGACASSAAPALRGAVLKDSYLDVSGIAHWTRLPDLERFAEGGYPFTRRADLADTLVVLPGTPSSRELEMFLDLMARFGAQTGLPAIHVTVGDAGSLVDDSGKDVLLLGTAADQPALKRVNEALPVAIEEDRLRLRDPEGFFGRIPSGLLAKLRGRPELDDSRFGTMESEAGLPDAVVEEAEWPRGSGHTVVVVALRKEGGAPGMVDAMEAGSLAGQIAGSVSVLHAGEFIGYRLGGSEYWVGAVSPLMRLQYRLEESPSLVAAAVGVFCFLIAVLVQAGLRRRARQRLQGAR
ncbi:MAG TPA: UDP-forming cellulose synthase catalytic subunit [Acidobacteriaceae bacterium]|nr:UDP-forming cellulose synthase catalytic subunit [Acidobacteriaceae bacterium]